MMRLLIFLAISITCVQLLYAQDTTATKKAKEGQAAETPKPEAPKTEAANPEPPKTEAVINNPMSPPTFSGQSTQPKPYIVITKEEYEKELRPEQMIRNIMPGARRDTLPPKYIADASYLPIITWDKPPLGANILEVDTNTSVIKPVFQVTQRSDILVDLTAWKQESKVYSIPFMFMEEAVVHLSRYFTMPSSAKSYKKVYLYFEGIAWKSEVKLNGKFLGINENPFQAWAIPIESTWLREEENYLEISLSTKAKDFPFYPQPFLGIYRPVYIVNDLQLQQISKVQMPEITKTQDTVAIYAPYFYEKKYVFDKFHAVNVLLHAKRAGINHVYFLFPPNKELQKLCKEMEFTKVKQLTKGQAVAWLNKYPYQVENFSFAEQFWLDERAYRTKNYRSIVPYDASFVFAEKKRVSLLYAFWVLFPVLAMFFIKILNAKFFNSFVDTFIQPRLAIDKFMESTAGNRGLLIILQGIRVIIIALCLTLMVDYMQTNNQWHILRPFGGNGLIFTLFGFQSPFWLNMFKSLLLVAIWSMVRTALIRTLSGLFRIYNMYEGLTNLELTAAYPLIFILPLPLTMLSFVDAEWHSFMLVIQGLLVSFYLARQVYVCYVGMGKLFRFSFSVKWLYIIGGIIFPYLICL